MTPIVQVSGTTPLETANFAVIEPEPDGIEVVIDIRPNTMHAKSKGLWVTCYITPPEGYCAQEIDISTVKLEGIDALSNDYGYVDIDLDGICELMVKFERSEIIALIPEGINDAYPLHITGKFLDDIGFYGVDSVKTIKKLIVLESLTKDILLVSIDIRPDTLHLHGNSSWVTCYITPHDGYDARDIVVPTVTLEGLSPISDKYGYVDIDLDGVCELMIKFDKATLLSLLPTETTESYPLHVRGDFLDGVSFYGMDTVHIIYK